jgi:hypothetical protein
LLTAHAAAVIPVDDSALLLLRTSTGARRGIVPGLTSRTRTGPAVGKLLGDGLMLLGLAWFVPVAIVLIGSPFAFVFRLLLEVAKRI